MNALVRRSKLTLAADPRRVVATLFLPGQEMTANGVSRADSVILRILAMSQEQVARALTETAGRFGTRHQGLPTILEDHYELVAHRMPPAVTASAQQRQLIGAYFTKEYSVEAAALFNPSMVAHPDQSGLAAGELRFVMSVRAVGEGHISSIEFRTGVIGAKDTVTVDDPGQHLVNGRQVRTTMSREFLRDAVADRPDAALARHVLELLPEHFDAGQLDHAVTAIARDHLTRGSADAILDHVRWIASCNYRLHFPAERPLSERVIYPISVDERQGVEDARFTRFTEEDGRATYFGTYTAFDGSRISPHLLQTDDFTTFESSQLIGPAAKDKGMALFPRRIGGQYVALSRWDRESIGVATSPDALRWGTATTVQAPARPWELIQLGNCGSPIETPHGWLVLTHGVGAMREYGIGAILLGLDEPTKLIGSLPGPLLMPSEEERDGYVPNVVYSCGSLVHAGTLVLPYGCSDSSIRFAFVDLAALLDRLAS